MLMLSPTTQSSCYRRGFLFLQSHLKPINQPSIPGTIFHLAPSAMAGFFSAQNPVLTTSPDLHQNMSRSPPRPCTGVHQKGCDLGGVEGVTPPNIHSSIQWPTPKQPKVSLLRQQPLTLHSLLHLLRLHWQFLQSLPLLLRRRVGPSPSPASSSPVASFSGEDTDFVAIHLPKQHSTHQ